MKIYMTDEQFEHGHRLMWLELGETGGMVKEETKVGQALGELCLLPFISTPIHIAARFDCFACGEAYKRSKNKIRNCDLCPIEWPEMPGVGLSAVPCSRSLYRKWIGCEEISEKKQIALQIAQLPWKRRSE